MKDLRKKEIVKDRQLKVRVTEIELLQIKTNAKNVGLDVSAYVLLNTIGAKPIVKNNK
jgi:predicted DNA binding CopG/RHH family protein